MFAVCLLIVDLLSPWGSISLRLHGYDRKDARSGSLAGCSDSEIPSPNMPVIPSLQLLALLITAVQPASPAGAAYADLDVASARAAVEAWFEQQRVPAMTVAVVRDGDTLFSEAFGVADRERELPATRETLFRIGSVSKALSSVALGRMVARGLVSLDASPRAALPDLPEPYGAMTLRQIAGHLAGISHYRGVDFVNTRHYESAIDAVSKFRDRPLVAAPGERFLYSSYGWNLLGAVLEASAGKSFQQIVGEEVIAPFGLRRTRLEVAGETVEDRAESYAVLTSSMVRAPRIDNSDAYPSAGFLSTADELARFGWLVLEDSVMPAATRQLLWSEQQAADGTGTGYGLGWQWSGLAGRRAVGHGGSHVGATAAFWIVPEEELVVAALVNTNVKGLDALVAAVIEDLTAPPPSAPAAIP
jgi:CubicO group peptidase (beta-lactamase class C family)